MNRRSVVFLFIALIGFAGFWIGCNQDLSQSPAGPASFDTGATSGKPTALSGEVHAQIPIRGHLEMTANTDGCDNSHGPNITINGALTLGGVNGRLIFRNNERGTHEYTEETDMDVMILEEGEVIRFAKQPSRGGVGGNPYIWIEFCDGDWTPMSKPILLGRCVQGLFSTNFDFGLMSDANAQIITGDCDNSGGPEITLSGELLLGGMNAKLIFTNNRRGTHRLDEDTTIAFAILPPGKSITFAKQPPRGGAGGNPHILFQWMDPNNSELSDEFYLGRCVQLSH